MHSKNYQLDILLFPSWLFPSKISVSSPQASTSSRSNSSIAGLHCCNVVCSTLLHFLIFKVLTSTCLLQLQFSPFSLIQLPIYQLDTLVCHLNKNVSSSICLERTQSLPWDHFFISLDVTCSCHSLWFTFYSDFFLQKSCRFSTQHLADPAKEEVDGGWRSIPVNIPLYSIQDQVYQGTLTFYLSVPL